MVTHCHGSSSPLFACFCRPILSTKHDSAVYLINEVESNELEAFYEKVTQMFHILSSVESHEFLSVSWISKLLDGFLSCQEQFRVLLSRNKACLSKHGLQISLSDYFERSVESLDVCNAIRDGIEEMKQWRNQLEIVFCALNSQETIGEAQFRRAKRALNDLEMKINDGKESGLNLAQRNQSFNLKKLRYRVSEFAHSKSFSWSVSRSWSASKQLQVIGKNIMVPKRSEIIATGGLVLAIYTMSHVLHFVMWALVAAIPCQGRGAQSHFIFPMNFTWGSSMFKLQQRILDEYKKRDRKNTCGLLKEIHGVEVYTRYINGFSDKTQFPLEEEQGGEMNKRIEKLRIVYEYLQRGLDPLERRVREVFLGIARCSSENDLKESLIFALPLMEGEGFSKETIRVEYERKPPRCHLCKIFGHGIDQCPKKPNEAASTQSLDDGFEEVKRKKEKGKQPEKARNIDSVRLNKPQPSFYYCPKKKVGNTNNVASTSKKTVSHGTNIATPNPFNTLVFYPEENQVPLNQNMQVEASDDEVEDEPNEIIWEISRCKATERNN